MRISAVTFSFIFLFTAGFVQAQFVSLITHEQETRVDVEVDGKLFTSYRWDEKIKRPVLFPIISAGGAVVTRGFPFETRDGESIDHPHQVGSSFSYGDVNGIDFWNTSTYRTEKELEKMGRIVTQKILEVKSGDGRGVLVTRSLWIHPNGKTLLIETTRYTFNANGKRRWVDRETTLLANDENVVFGDSKEGLFAIRLATELEQEDQISVKTTTAKGVISDRASKENLTGKYTNSEGLMGDKVWGTTGKWASVSGKIGGEEVTVAIFDSPKNTNFPSYMMVRGYGLLALNPFGQKQFVPSKEENKFTLPAKRSMVFRHRLLILSKKTVKGLVEDEYQKFID